MDQRFPHDPAGRPVAFVEQPQRHYDDEVSLYDLWNVLVRQRLLIATVLALTVAAATVYVLLTPISYEFRSGIDIGYVYRGEDVVEDRYRPVASADAAQTRLNDVIIPAVSRQRANAEGTARRVDVALNKADNSLLLTTTAPLEAEQEVVELHTAIAAALAEQYQPYFQRERALVTEQLQVQVSALGQELAADQQQVELLEEVDYTAVGQPGVVALVNAQRMSDLRRDIAKKQSELARLNATMGGVQEASRDTRLSFVASQSKQPTGVGAPFVLALALVMGLMMGVFACFACEFAASARRKREVSIQQSCERPAQEREQAAPAQYDTPESAR